MIEYTHIDQRRRVDDAARDGAVGRTGLGHPGGMVMGQDDPSSPRASIQVRETLIFPYQQKVIFHITPRLSVDLREFWGHYWWQINDMPPNTQGSRCPHV